MVVYDSLQKCSAMALLSDAGLELLSESHIYIYIYIYIVDKNKNSLKHSRHFEGTSKFIGDNICGWI